MLIPLSNPICSKTTSEQELLLKKPATRKAFKEVMNDLPTGSLQKSTTLPMRCAGSLSKIRRVFRACHETLISKIDGGMLQGPRKVRHIFKEECKSIKARRRSRQIDMLLKRDPRPKSRFYIYGFPWEEIYKIVEQIKIISRDGYTDEERLTFRDSIRTKVLSIARTVAETLGSMEIGPDTKLLAQRLLEELEHIQPDSSEITPEVAFAIKSLSESSRESLAHVQNIAWSSISNYCLP